jgi:kynurenine 3-monooxygenase
VLIAGGGPGGYAAALALARAGFEDIHVIESNSSASYYEETKAFCMVLFPHGKEVLRNLGVLDIDQAGAHPCGVRAHVLCMID